MPEPDIDPLRHFALLKSASERPTAYYQSLTKCDDQYLVAAGWCRMLESGAVSESQWGELLSACTNGGVAKAAFEYFESLFEHDLARDAASRATRSLSALRAKAFKASLSFDYATAADTQGEYFLENDDVGHLLHAAKLGERAGGWRSALPWSVRAVLTAPFDEAPWAILLLRLADARQDDLLQTAISSVEVVNLLPELVPVFKAETRLNSGDPQASLAMLAQLDDARIAQSPRLGDLRTRILGLRFQSLDALGLYTDAYAALRKRHEAERTKSENPKHFADAVRRISALSAPPLPPDPRSDVVQMLGFPRSGTTLLENALSQHERIETFEEIPAQNAMFTRLGNELERAKRDNTPVIDAYLAARQAYYTEIDRRRRKDAATVLIEKMPIASADANALRQIFPDRRYIFSIRHPFDAVLSCLRQTFKTNAAMANFLALDSAVATYDLTMSQWFAHFRLDSPQVYYVRYEDLVLRFDDTMGEIFSFLGLGWDAGVRDFAQAAETRRAATPSYQKVRQGLSIGVQTAWRNYDFLFNTPEAKPLHNWAEFFGYPTT